MFLRMALIWHICYYIIGLTKLAYGNNPGSVHLVTGKSGLQLEWCNFIGAS